MKKEIFLFLFLALFLIPIVSASSGCCSGHGGVDCAAGPQSNGHVICNDAWTGSSCLYSSMVMCEDYNIPEDEPEEESDTPAVIIEEEEEIIEEPEEDEIIIEESEENEVAVIKDIEDTSKNEEVSEKIEIINLCGGCDLEGKCYPINNIKDGKYCSVDKTWVEQKDKEEACENNFECKTNVCIDKACVSSGVIQKFFKWLGRLFG